jgi:hypothetical protein
VLLQVIPLIELPAMVNNMRGPNDEIKVHVRLT